MNNEVSLIHCLDPFYNNYKHKCNSCNMWCKVYAGKFKVISCTMYKQKELWKFHGWCGKIKPSEKLNLAKN